MTGQIEFEDYPAAYPPEAAAADPTAGSGSIEVAGGVEYQPRKGLRPICSTSEAVKHSFVACRIYLEHDSATWHASPAKNAEITPELGRAVQIALGIQH